MDVKKIRQLIWELERVNEAYGMRQAESSYKSSYNPDALTINDVKKVKNAREALFKELGITEG